VWGGAALAAHRLHLGLRHLGQESTMFVAHSEGGGQDVLRFLPPRDFGSRLARTFRRKSLARSVSLYSNYRGTIPELFSDDRSQHGEAPFSQIPACDIVNYHWISGFLDSDSMFRKISEKTLHVWTIHDMNAFTGGCHYDAGCHKYRRNCGACPQLGGAQEQDLSRQIWNRRKAAYSRLATSQLQLVAPSRWIASELQQSSLLGRFPVTVIPNGVDLDAFSPRDKAFSRSVLGLPQEAKVLLFAGHSINEQRKGFSLLLQALEGLREVKNLHLLAVGGYSLLPHLGIPFHPLGYISTERLLSIAYSAADLCVVPTLQDNLPNITLESLACGTPVVGFNVGGMADVVSDGHDGFLVPSANPKELRESIRLALSNLNALSEMGVRCRRTAIERFSIHMQAQEYLKLYESFAGFK
jgi:glycosyltransferase involved in cell wall biosynthesis